MTQLTIDAIKDDPSIIENFYHDAMIEGYASLRSKPRKVANLPDSKQALFERDEWMLSDAWHVTPISDFLGGETHIYFEGKLIWMMQYFGRCPRNLIPFLKQALAQQYWTRRFNGGRGPKELIYEGKGLIYRNRAKRQKFMHFYGEETLGPIDGPATKLNSGYHRYQGGLML